MAQEPTMANSSDKPSAQPMRPQTGGNHPSPEALNDVSNPQTDEELNDALEDTFPASDPINFAGSSAGRPTRNEDMPVGTHPMAGAEPDGEDARGQAGGGNLESGLDHVSIAAFGDDEPADDDEEDDATAGSHQG
jgi:hypothetical protein